jgi:acetyl/propionyl-CoA carboxylase alpha subunit
MIQSLLIANRAKIARRIIRSQILPGTGRCPNGAEGSQAGHQAMQVESWDPSVASRHLPVPGRI